MNVSEKKQLQFELWEECNSNCSFCYLGNLKKKTPDQIKLKNLEATIEKINDDRIYNDINCIGFIGGEFFQGQLENTQVKNKFMELMQVANDKLINGKVKQVWISASLLVGDQHDLFDTLNRFAKLDNVWILTSYDTIGRFHTQLQKNNWISNLKTLRQTYSDIKLNITAITTGDFIDTYLAGKLDLFNIANEHRCSCFLKPPCIPVDYTTKQLMNDRIPNFFPTRSQMLDFLIKYKQESSDYDFDKLFNINYRADYLQTYGTRYQVSHRIKDGFYEHQTIDGNDVAFRQTKCGHSPQYQIYIDTNKCLICDKLKIKNMFR